MGSTEFLDRLASQLKTGKDAACRRAIERILDGVKKSYESGKYEDASEAERDFRQLVEGDEKARQGNYSGHSTASKTRYAENLVPVPKHLSTLLK